MGGASFSPERGIYACEPRVTSVTSTTGQLTHPVEDIRNASDAEQVDRSIAPDVGHGLCHDAMHGSLDRVSGTTKTLSRGEPSNRDGILAAS